MRPSLFVGSSRESVTVAQAVQWNLQNEVDVTLWNQIGFPLNKSILESLLREVRRYDYGVFVFAPDDLIRFRKKELLATRDNVVFELGLFMSTIGPERCFFLVPHTKEPFRIPSDLNGINMAYYDPNSHDGNLKACTGVACSQISEAIRNSSPLSGVWLLYIAGSAQSDPNGTIFIVCAGERATARLSLTKSIDGNTISRDFQYEGRYVAGQFAMTFVQRNAEDQIVGSIIFRANSSRSEMQGQSVFWHRDRSEMVATAFTLRRQSNKKQ